MLAAFNNNILMTTASSQTRSKRMQSLTSRVKQSIGSEGSIHSNAKIDCESDYTKIENKNTNYYIHALKDLKGYQYVNWLTELRRTKSNRILKPLEYTPHIESHQAFFQPIKRATSLRNQVTSTTKATPWR